VDSPAIPHYNSHNIYSRPSTVPSTMPIGSLPAIVPPITPLSDDNHNGDNMHSDSPVVPLPEPSEIWPLCAYCQKGGDLSRCSSCRQAYYCNRECQVAHWEVHCIVCQPGPPQPPSLPVGGQPVSPPKSVRSYTTMSPQQYAVSPQQHTVRANGYGHTMNGHTTSIRRRSYDQDGMNKEQYYCEECDRYFKNGQALGGHRSRVHSSRRNGDIHIQGQPPPHHGNYHQQGSPQKKQRRRARPSRARHEPTGNGQYVCPHCSREFASGNALGGHISGAHTKKSRRLAEQQQQQRRYQQQMQQQRHGYARPRHPHNM